MVTTGSTGEIAVVIFSAQVKVILVGRPRSTRSVYRRIYFEAIP